MDCSLPGSSVHGILQARTVEWVAVSFPRGSSWPRDLHCRWILYWLSHQGSPLKWRTILKQLITSDTKPRFSCLQLRSQEFKTQVSVERKDTEIRKAGILGRRTCVQKQTEDSAQPWQFLYGKEESQWIIEAEVWFLHHSPLHADWLALFRCSLAPRICLQDY